MLTLRRPIAVFLLLMLAGCAARPLTPAPANLPLNWQTTTPVATQTGDLRAWWRGFADPTLDALVARALTDNLQMGAARQRLLAARQLREHSGDRYLPYLRAKTDEVISPNASASFLMMGLDAVWEAGLFGRREGTRRLAQADLDMADATLEGASVSLIGEVVADFLQIAALSQKLPLLAQQEQLLAQRMLLLQRRVALGLSGSNELAESRLQQLQVRGEQLETEHQLQSLRWQLALLLGTDTLALPEPGLIALPEQLPTMPKLLPADLLRTRPDVRAAEARVLQEAGAEAIAAAERLPNFALAGSLVTSGNIVRHRNTTEYTLGSIGPLIDIPLFDWGQRRANALAHGHLLQAASLDYRRAILSAYTEVETTLDDVARSAQREADQREADALANRAAERTDLQVQLGLTSPLQANLSQSAVVQARLALLETRATRALSYVALFKSLGGAPLAAEAVPGS